MIRLLNYLITRKIATSKALFAPLGDGVRGLPMLTGESISEAEAVELAEGCPAGAIRVLEKEDGRQVLEMDRGACTTCGFCLDVYPTAAIKSDPNTMIATRKRDQLISSVALNDTSLDTASGVAGDTACKTASGVKTDTAGGVHEFFEAADNLPQDAIESDLARENLISKIFGRSIAIRVVSTGCSSCDLEIGAAGNPIFDMERFGMHVVASPRFADVLLVTGPVPKAMHEPLRLCYEAMSEPRLVVAVGSCAISGGVLKDSYAQANGVGAVLPVDVFIPGCPPHPWSIIDGIAMAMGRKRQGRLK
ncbi:NADH-quinone oxidoreductase subunit NuoB [Candidatus Obscuribacterales bacterium]|nr:NADH-quinone oxidoreductase subunit NuoB [Candidatus Obscuribacterales bacterium]MBX3150939.1 NADH-quinone oxidoreductase subunit NuoB [Candidatus Obscuribacterales bacterium]